MQWTKGFTAKGVEGQEIGQMLQDALARQVGFSGKTDIFPSSNLMH